MELDITKLKGMDCFPLAHSPAESKGDPWAAAVRAAEEQYSGASRVTEQYHPLFTEEERGAVRSWVKTFGGGTDKEVEDWTPLELDALLLQLIALEVREAGGYNLDGVDWAGVESGEVSSRLSRAEDGTVTLYIGE
jgi:hypothetical protein